MKRFLFISSISILFLSVVSDLQKKVIRSNGYDIECYVSLKSLKYFEANRMYYWFKAGDIHKSLSSAGGLVLHDSYKKFYRTNQMAEEGQFQYGLKDGIWKDWSENGNLKTVSEWRAGFRHGDYMVYDVFGNLEEQGRFKNNMKSGEWINYKTNDTLDYKKDKMVIIDSLNTKPGLFKRIFTKRDSLQKVQDRRERIEKRKTDSINRELRKRVRENNDDGFFKRLFSKKKD